MAEKYMFFNSTATDRRRQQASDMADYWQSFLSTGLINEGTHLGLQVVADAANMSVKIKPGRALIKGHLYINDSDLTHFVEGAHATLSRIDRIILRYDNTINSRFIKAFVLKGEPSENPVAPALTREGDIYELSLAQIHVQAGKSFIEQSDVIDERLDEALCGLATALGHVPTDVYNAEFEAYMQKIQQEWQDWYNTMYDAAFVTQDEYKANKRDVGRQLANLNAIADIDNRAIGNTGKFYDLFDGSNDMSIAKARLRKDTILKDAEIGDNAIMVSNANVFEINKEYTLIGPSQLSDNDLKYEDILVTAINQNENSIIIQSPLTNRFVETSSVVESTLKNDGTFLETITTSNFNTLTSQLLMPSSVYGGSYFYISEDNTWIYDGWFLYKYNGSTYVREAQYGNNNVDGTFINEVYFTQITGYLKTRNLETGTTVQNTDGGFSVGLYYQTYETETHIFFISLAGANYSSFSTATRSIVGYTFNKTTETFSGKWTYNIANSTSGNYQCGIFPKDKLMFIGATSPSSSNDGFVDYVELEIDNTTYDYPYIKQKAGIPERITISRIELGSNVYDNGRFRDVTFNVKGNTLLAFNNATVGAYLRIGYDPILDTNIYQILSYQEPTVFSGLVNGMFISPDDKFIFLFNIDMSGTGGNANYRVFTAVGDKLRYITSIATSQFVSDGTSSYAYTVMKGFANSHQLKAIRNIGSNNNSIALISGSKVSDILNNIIRYDIDGEVKNLASWLLFNESPSSVKITASLIDEGEMDNYQSIPTTNVDGEYESIISDNLYSKNNASLKIEVVGAKPYKLLGAVE